LLTHFCKNSVSLYRCEHPTLADCRWNNQSQAMLSWAQRNTVQQLKNRISNTYFNHVNWAKLLDLALNALIARFCENKYYSALII